MFYPLETARQVIVELCAGGGNQRKRLARQVGNGTVEAVVGAATNRDQRRPLVAQQSDGAGFKYLRVQSSVESVQNRLMVWVERDGGGSRDR